MDARRSPLWLVTYFAARVIPRQVPGLGECARIMVAADWRYRHVWAYLPVFYFLGVALAGRRYR